MKILSALTLVLCAFLNAYPQKSPEYFVGKMPVLPRTACDMRTVDRDEYLDKVSQLSDLLREEIQLRKEARDAFVAENTDKMQQNMANQMGMSKTDMEKLKKDGDLSDNEAMAMAEKMIKKSGISMAEAKNLGNMSDADQKAWAEGHSAEGSTMADVAHSRAVMLKIYGHQLVYCEKMTPIILDILERDLSVIKASLPDRYRLQQIVDEQMKAQSGVDIKTIAPDLLAMESLTAHIDLMKGVFRFVPMEKPGNN